MDNLYKTAIFIDPKGKVVYRLSKKPINKYFWEKEKAQIVEWLIKEKFYNKGEIQVKEVMHEQEI